MYSSRLPLALFMLALATFVAAWANRPPEPLVAAPSAAAHPTPRAGVPRELATRLDIRVHHRGPTRRWAPVVYGDHAHFRVALTFDDGPHTVHTPRLLDILARHHTKATFFINGYWLDAQHPAAARARAILARAHAEGHLIGNHTYSHRLLSHLTPEQQTFEILANERLIERITGHRPHLFRPPYGVMTDHSRALIARHGYVDARWCATSHDEHKPAKSIAREVISWIIHHEGGIILLHDTQKESVEAVDLILAKLTRINRHRTKMKRPLFHVVSLDQLLQAPGAIAGEVDEPVDVEAYLAAHERTPRLGGAPRSAPAPLGRAARPIATRGRAHLSKHTHVRYGGASPTYGQHVGHARSTDSGRSRRAPGSVKDGPITRHRNGTRLAARTDP